MKISKDKIVEWSLGSIVGNIVWGAAFLGITAAVGYLNGSLGTVLEFTSEHKGEAAAWSAVLFLFGVLAGIIIRHRVAKSQFAAKDDEIANLSKRPMREQMDEALAEKDAEIEKLKQRESEQVKEVVLTRDQAHDFVRNLTPRQHAILREMYDNGGTITADPLDGELQWLSSHGLANCPPLFTPGLDVKWTMPPNVYAIIKKEPEIVGESEPSLNALLNLSPVIARTMLELCEKETLPFGKASNEVVKSIVHEEGYFERPLMGFCGNRWPADIYRLTQKWRAFLADEGNRETLRRLLG